MGWETVKEVERRWKLTSGKVPLEKTLSAKKRTVSDLIQASHGRPMDKMGSTYINRQVLPQAPSPTMTSLRRISAILRTGEARSAGLREREYQRANPMKKKKKKEFVQSEQIGEMVGSQNEKNGKEK